MNKLRKSRTTKFILIFLFIFQMICLPLYQVQAKEVETYQDYVNILYNSENGLPTSEANDVVQTEDGFIWIASYSGLIRYDGDSFKRFSDSNAVASANVLFIDSEGILWIGTNDNGIVQYDNGEYEIYNVSNGLISNSVKDIVEDEKGNLYVGTTEGISYLEKKDKTVHDCQMEDDADTYIDSMCVIDGKTLIYSTNSGKVYCLKNGEPSEFKMPNLEKGQIILSVSPAKDGWILGTDSNVIYQCMGTLDDYTYEKYTCGNLERINCAKYISNGALWICSDTGVGFFDADMNFHELSEYQINNSVDNMIEDFEGNLWFSSSRQGIFKCTTNYFSNMSKKAGLSDFVVNSIVKYHDDIYAATDTGLIAFDSTNQLVENSLTDYLKDIRIRCLVVDSKDNLWACTYGETGLVRYDGTNIISLGTESGIQTSKVRSAIESITGTMIVATANGIYFVQEDKVTSHIGKAEGLNNLEVLTLCELNDGTLYAGTDGGGIYEIKDGKITDLIDETDGLRSGIVMRIRYDEQENGLWIITSNSIAFYQDGKVKNIDKFPYSNNYDLYFGKDDSLWILSSNGLYIVQRESMLDTDALRYTFYNYNNGMPSTPTANSFSYMDQDNDLFYFCGSSGVYSMKMDELSDSNATKLTIADIVVDGETIQGINDNYIIPADSKRVRVEAYALSYGLQNPLISYYLEGFEEEQTVVRKADITDISYTNLKGGDYTFHFSIIDPNTGEVLDTKTVQLHKEYMLTEKVWFYPVILLAIILVIFLIAFITMKLHMNRVLLKNKEEQQMELEKALNMANNASAAKGIFLSNMSHDIRTPMNAIIGMTKLAQSEKNMDTVQGYLSNIDSSSNFLLGLINDILDMSKIESGEFSLRLEKYNKKDFEISINNIIRPLMEKKNIEFIYEMKDSVGCMMVDKLRMNQIFFNLLSNASKFTPEGGKVEFLSFSIPEKNGLSGIRFIVRDNGCGMSKEYQKDMFVPFVQENSSQKGQSQGTGLGLPIVKSIIDAMNGTITVKSDVGQGTEYTIDLYVQEVEVEKEKEDTIVSIENKMDGSQILLVEDNDMNILVARKLLESKGCNVTIAKNGQEAIIKFEEADINYYDAILMDVRMPVMDGIEATKVIRSLEREDVKQVPIIAMTADAFVEEQKRTFEAGMNAHLTKPIEPVKLFETLNGLIN